LQPTRPQPAVSLFPYPTLFRSTPLETEPIEGEPCRFRTGYPVTLWPIEVELASLARPPAAAPLTPRSTKAAAVLRLVLRCRGDEIGRATRLNSSHQIISYAVFC